MTTAVLIFAGITLLFAQCRIRISALVCRMWSLRYVDLHQRWVLGHEERAEYRRALRRITDAARLAPGPEASRILEDAARQADHLLDPRRDWLRQHLKRVQ